MNDLSTIRRLLSFGLVFLMLNVLQITIVTAILLAMYWPLGVVVLVSIAPITLIVLHFERRFTRLSRLAQDQAGHVATHVEESALGLRAVKSFGREDYVYERFDEQGLYVRYDTQIQKVSVSAEVLDAARGDPQPHVDRRARLRCLCRRARAGDPRHAGRLHHDDAVARVADRLAGFPAVDDPGVDDGGQPDRRDLRRARRDHRRRTPRGAARWTSGVDRCRLPLPGVRRQGLHLGAAPRRFDRRTGGDTGTGRRHRREGGSGARRAAAPALRRHRRLDRIDGTDIRDLSLDALRTVVATAFEDPTLSRCRWPKTCGWAGLVRTTRTGASHRDRRRAVRLRPALRTADPDRGAGNEPVRRSAATTFTGPRHPVRTAHPGARRHPVRTRRSHRGGGHRSTATGAGRRSPGVVVATASTGS